MEKDRGCQGGFIEATWNEEAGWLNGEKEDQLNGGLERKEEEGWRT